MKFSTRLLCLILSLLTLLSASSCAGGKSPSETSSTSETLPPVANTESPPAEPTPVPLTADVELQTVYLYVGESYSLPHTLSAREDHAAVTNPVWISSHDCVTVKDGIVTAVSEGYAIVSAGGTTDCLIRVLPNTLPILSIDTNYEKINSKETYTACTIDVESESGDFDMTCVSGGIRLRGNSTSRRPKVPYRIRFDEKRNLLGLNAGAKCRSWVLIAEYQDDSYTRTAASLSLASVILGEYSSDWCFVDLYINGRHIGVYTLCEQSQINENRIDIEEAGEDSPALQSGYLFEFDGANPNTGKPTVFYDDYDITIFPTNEEYEIAANDAKTYGKLFYELKNDGVSAEQTAFAQNYFQSILDLIYYATYEDVFFEIDEKTGMRTPSNALNAEEAIRAAVDIESAARMYILSEIICNSDEYKKSFYFYVDFSENGTGKLTFACPWDFDGTIVKWATYDFKPYNEYFATQQNIFYVMLMNNEFFRETVAKIWRELYEETNGFENVIHAVSRISEVYAEELAVEKELWDRANDQAKLCEKTCKWLKLRINWLNQQFSNFLSLF